MEYINNGVIAGVVGNWAGTMAIDKFTEGQLEYRGIALLNLSNKQSPVLSAALGGVSGGFALWLCEKFISHDFYVGIAVSAIAGLIVPPMAKMGYDRFKQS
jgi:hypothetical protein